MREANPINKIYVEEIATQLHEMAISETRRMLRLPSTLTHTNLCLMLEKWGWFKGRHYVTGVDYYNDATGLKFAVKDRPRFFTKVSHPAATKKSKPVDSVLNEH